MGTAFLTLTLIASCALGLAARPLNDTYTPDGWQGLMDPPRSIGASSDGTTILTPTEIATFVPYTNLARVAYCPSEVVASWTCGDACKALPGMQVYATGGNGKDIPNWFVGYLPSLESAVVVHEGTSPDEVKSVLVDAHFLFDKLNPTFFPNVDLKIEVHDGFSNAQEKSAPAILDAVKRVMSDTKTTKVVCVGHSLGGALASLDAVFLRLALPQSTSFKVITYGQPRVGNQEFADYFDTNFPDHARITNNRDVVPIVPGRKFGFVHFSYEKHIDANGVWRACNGRDNDADKCSIGAVESVIRASVSDHSGPYDGILITGCVGADPAQKASAQPQFKLLYGIAKKRVDL